VNAHGRGESGESIGPEPPPLAEAAHRLRRRPGRPRKHEVRHVSRHSAPQVAVAAGAVGGPQDQQSSTRDRVGRRPRLLDLKDAANYLGVSDWTVRKLMAQGHVHPVRLPGVCRLLFDVRGLDQLVERQRSEPVPSAENGEG
jgi:hypothetical protein